MNDQEIDEFLKAFDDFMRHSENEELTAEMRKEYQQYSKKIIDDQIVKMIEKKAAELEVTVDYYMDEFM